MYHINSAIQTFPHIIGVQYRETSTGNADAEVGDCLQSFLRWHWSQQISITTCNCRNSLTNTENTQYRQVGCCNLEDSQWSYNTCMCVHVLYRILFPMLSGGDQNISQTGLMRTEGFSDPDDYVDIESGQTLYAGKTVGICRVTLCKYPGIQSDETPSAVSPSGSTCGSIVQQLLNATCPYCFSWGHNVLC